MTKGKKYDPSPLASATASTDNWLSPNSAHDLGYELLDDPNWFEDEYEIDFASTRDHLLVLGIAATGLLALLRLTGLI
ncbi:MAG: hypothetical protein HRU41_38025 [Saprospiraceae bacterium]|nr:hypothetical protein [Saprospiraceae bacterium]